MSSRKLLNLVLASAKKTSFASTLLRFTLFLFLSLYLHAHTYTYTYRVPHFNLRLLTNSETPTNYHFVILNLKHLINDSFHAKLIIFLHPRQRSCEVKYNIFQVKLYREFVIWRVSNLFKKYRRMDIKIKEKIFEHVR